MSTRCKACNKELSEGEMLSLFKRSDGEHERRDMCSKCHRIAMQTAHGGDWIDEDEETTAILAEVGITAEMLYQPEIE